MKQVPLLPMSMSSLLIPLLLLLKLLLHQTALAQKLPIRDEDHFHFQISNEEIFYDTKLLPDGAEVSTYLLRGVESRYYFVVEEESSPMSVTISACSSALDWYVAYHPDTQEGSADGLPQDDEDDLLNQNSGKLSQNKHGPVILEHFTTESRTTYLNEWSMPGIYSIVITAKDSDSSVQMFATTSPFSDQPHPKAPQDSSVKVKRVTSSTVTLTWSPSDSSQHQDITYCVAVNRRYNFATMCAAEAYVYGESPPTPPPFAGFGFSWEQEKQDNFRSKAHPKPAADPMDATFKCVGSKTSYTFRNALPGQLYYFDVYAVNRLLDTSTSYTGVNATTLNDTKVISLKDGKMHTVFLKRSRPQRTFTYEVSEKIDELLIAVKPCSGRAHVRISYENGILESSRVKDLSYFRIEKPQIGLVWIHVTADRSRTMSLQLFVSSDHSVNPYPEIPGDNEIRIYKSTPSTSCNSITLGWRGTSQPQKYCLYMHRFDKHQSRKRHKRHNGCIGHHTRKKSEKVMCRSFQTKGKKRNIIRETIKGLQPRTTYMFDVYVQKPHGESVSYGRIWATTNKTCRA